jgi:hypothetical protein
LQMSSLIMSGLQTGTGLHSTARGLTPAEDWRRLFPLKEAATR